MWYISCAWVMTIKNSIFHLYLGQHLSLLHDRVVSRPRHTCMIHCANHWVLKVTSIETEFNMNALHHIEKRDFGVCSITIWSRILHRCLMPLLPHWDCHSCTGFRTMFFMHCLCSFPLPVYLNATISPLGLSSITKTTHGDNMHFQSPPFW